MNQIVHLYPLIERLTSLMVNRQYFELEKLTKSARLPATQIKEAVEGYGKTVIAPPSSGYNQIDAVLVKDSHPKTWSLVIPLWTKEEGKSDLSIELTVIETQPDYTVELDDIRVL